MQNLSLQFFTLLVFSLLILPSCSDNKDSQDQSGGHYKDEIIAYASELKADQSLQIKEKSIALDSGTVKLMGRFDGQKLLSLDLTESSGFGARAETYVWSREKQKLVYVYRYFEDRLCQGGDAVCLNENQFFFREDTFVTETQKSKNITLLNITSDMLQQGLKGQLDNVNEEVLTNPSTRFIDEIAKALFFKRRLTAEGNGGDLDASQAEIAGNGKIVFNNEDIKSTTIAGQLQGFESKTLLLDMEKGEALYIKMNSEPANANITITFLGDTLYRMTNKQIIKTAPIIARNSGEFKVEVSLPENQAKKGNFSNYNMSLGITKPKELPSKPGKEL